MAAREEMVARAVTADRMVLGGSDKNSDEQRSQEASRILADDDPSLAAARPNTRESKGEENLLESLHRDLSEHLLKREEDELRRKHANAHIAYIIPCSSGRQHPRPQSPPISLIQVRAFSLTGDSSSGIF